jgi:parallel beta-helix repeat protein
LNSTWMNKLRWIVALGLVGLFMVVGSPQPNGEISNPLPEGGSGIPTEELVDPTSNAEGQYFFYIPILRKPLPAYVVSTSGSDANPGTLAAPWLTLQHAVDTAIPGSIIYVRGGTYLGFIIERSNLTVSGYPDETAVVVGDGEQLNTIRVRNASGVVIRSLVVQDNALQYGTGIHVEDSSMVTISGNLFQDNHGFGVVLKNVSQVTVLNNEFRYNANAIEVRYGSVEVLIADNRIHHNYRDVDSGRSAIGINFYYTSGPIIARGNLLWENHTIDQADPGGAAFEVYAASNITIRENTIWDNETVLETGSDSIHTPCNNITFTRNTVFRGARQQGLILRCASNSLVAHNTFDALDNFVYDLSHYRGEYGASIEGLRILNNIHVYGRVYVIENALPVSVVIDYNLLYNPGSASQYGEYLAYVDDFGNTDSLAEFTSWTGYEQHGLGVNPLFVAYTQRNYALTGASPAIDAGVILSEPFIGLAPVLGRFEFIP